MPERGLTALDFVIGTTGASISDIRFYRAEIMSNRQFRESIEASRDSHSRRGFSGWGVSVEVGIILYSICRILRPEKVIETGVASGISSSYFICALEENRKGRLYSIDLPLWEEEAGWIVPDYLRHRWELIAGRSSDKLVPLLDKLGTIEVFFHDSEHTYENMLLEFNASWSHLAVGGILLSHNVDSSEAFPDFCKEISAKFWRYQNLGGIVKA